MCRFIPVDRGLFGSSWTACPTKMRGYASIKIHLAQNPSGDFPNRWQNIGRCWTPTARKCRPDGSTAGALKDLRMVKAIIETVVEWVIEIIKMILVMILWSFILYYLGRAVLWMLTFGRYRLKEDSYQEKNKVAWVGFLTILALWSGIAIYNNMTA